MTSLRIWFGVLLTGLISAEYEYPKCPDLCDNTYHKQCPRGTNLGAGDHLVALNLTMALSQENMWDIRVMQTDYSKDKSDLAKFYVSILDEVNYALYAAGKPYRACEESTILNTPTNCLSVQEPFCKQHVYQEDGVRKVSNYTHVIIECTSSRLTCPVRYNIGLAPHFPPGPCMAGAVSCGGFAGLIVFAIVLGGFGTYAAILLFQHKKIIGPIEMGVSMMGARAAGGTDLEGMGGPADFSKSEVKTPYERL